MFSIRARTLRPSSSRLVRSLGLSGSRWPSFHWPSPRLRLTGVVGGKAVPPDRSAAAPHRYGGRVQRRGGGSRGAGSVLPTERAAHPVQIHVAASHESQGQRMHVLQGATCPVHDPTASACWERTHILLSGRVVRGVAVREEG